MQTLGCSSFFILHSTSISWALSMCQTLSWAQSYGGDHVGQVLGTQGTKVEGQGDNIMTITKETNESTSVLRKMKWTPEDVIKGKAASITWEESLFDGVTFELSPWLWEGATQEADLQKKGSRKRGQPEESCEGKTVLCFATSNRNLSATSHDSFSEGWM